MNNKVVLVITIMSLILLCQSAFYENLQQQFKDLKIKSISQAIPQQSVNTKPAQQQKNKNSIQKLLQIKPIDMQTELKNYQQNYNQYLKSINGKQQQQQVSYNKQWNPDPQLSSKFELVSDRRMQSFILKGNELSRLVIDLTVTNMDPLITKNDGVYLVVVNLSQMDSDMIKYTEQQRPKAMKHVFKQFIEYKTQVRKHHFAVHPFTSDIYEILIFKHTNESENFTGVDVSLQINIQQQPITQKKQSNNNNEKNSLSPLQQQQMVLNMKKITEQNELTFLDSLQLWQKIQQHRRQHQKIYQWNQSIEWFECLGIVVLYVVEYVVFRVVTRKRVVV